MGKAERPRDTIFRSKCGIAILIVLQVALALVCLKTVPRIYGDEAWDSSLGYSLAYRGALKHEFIEGFGGMDIRFVQPRVVLPLCCAAVFTIAGWGIVTSRAVSVIFSVLAVVSIYGVTRRWFGDKQAFCIVLATILHPWFFEVSRRVRPEIYYLALAMAALWCGLYSAGSGSRRNSLLAGVLAGLAGLAHPSGFILVFAIAGGVLLWLRERLNRRLVLWASSGFVLALLPYVVYVLWAVQDPRVDFFEQMQSGTGQRTISLAGEIARWENFLQWPKGAPLAGIMLASWLMAWYRSTLADKFLATVIGLFSVVLPLLSTNTAGRYLAPLTPFFCALSIRFIWRTMADGGRAGQYVDKLRFFAGIGVAAIYAVMCVAAITIMFCRLHAADFTRVIDRVACVVGQEDRVYAQELFWVGHDRYRYGPFPLDYSVTPCRQTIEMVRKHRFDYAIRSAWPLWSSHGVSLPPVDMPDFRDWDTLDQVCRLFGKKIDEFRDPCFGPFEIYKLEW